jgi:hypothetical protein
VTGDYRLWWGLFVFFAGLSVLVVQLGYRRWVRVRRVLSGSPGPLTDELRRRLRREGWRLASMAVSVVVMTALVFAALLEAPAAAIVSLRVAAVAGVAAVLWLSLRR